MESVTFYCVQTLVSCMEFDDLARSGSKTHGDWVEHMTDHVLEVERSKRKRSPMLPDFV